MKFVKLLIDGLKRILAKPVVQKEPITADMLLKIVDKFGQGENLMHIRMCAMLLVAYAGFFRYDELSNLRLCDVIIFTSHVKFFINKSKNDQYREGAWVVVAASGKETCPVGMLQKYINLAELDLSAEDFLFKPVLFRKSKQVYQIKKGKLSYSRCREILHFALKEIQVDPKRYGLHSLRSGGVSAAAALGVPDRLLKKHGRWKTDVSKDRYVKEELANQLQVSSSLGL
ncbi:integrase/recombinase xerD homolog [Amphiura filiformis]|uniref:integrase/recombinase xerD homolog n=1 Tax=Amphiura filiformis TaxID=82378 RepID=UPI003B221175